MIAIYGQFNSYNFAVLVIAFSAFSGTASVALVITGYTDATNDRFSDDPEFIAGGFDLSGIGETGYRTMGDRDQPQCADYCGTPSAHWPGVFQFGQRSSGQSGGVNHCVWIADCLRGFEIVVKTSIAVVKRFLTWQRPC